MKSKTEKEGVKKMAKVRINLNFEENVLQNIDNYADTNGITRTGAVAMLVNLGLQQVNAPDMIDKLLSIISQASELQKESEK